MSDINIHSDRLSDQYNFDSSVPKHILHNDTKIILNDKGNPTGFIDNKGKLINFVFTGQENNISLRKAKLLVDEYSVNKGLLASMGIRESTGLKGVFTSVKSDTPPEIPHKSHGSRAPVATPRKSLETPPPLPPRNPLMTPRMPRRPASADRSSLPTAPMPPKPAFLEGFTQPPATPIMSRRSASADRSSLPTAPLPPRGDIQPPATPIMSRRSASADRSKLPAAPLPPSPTFLKEDIQPPATPIMSRRSASADRSSAPTKPLPPKPSKPGLLSFLKGITKKSSSNASDDQSLNSFGDEDESTTVPSSDSYDKSLNPLGDDDKSLTVPSHDSDEQELKAPPRTKRQPIGKPMLISSSIDTENMTQIKQKLARRRAPLGSKPIIPNRNELSNELSDDVQLQSPAFARTFGKPDGPILPPKPPKPHVTPELKRRILRERDKSLENLFDNS